VDVFGFVSQVGRLPAQGWSALGGKISELDREYIEENILHAVTPELYDKFVQEIEDARNAGDSVGGVVEVVARHVPVGLGEPVFGKLSADLAHAMVSIPAVKGFEIGDGFACASKRGSENNDVLENRDGEIRTSTNHAGGIVGGISNGEDIVVRIALKPASSIVKEQQTVDSAGNETTIQVHGRHDPCVCSRAVPIAEAMMVLVLVDHYLMNKISKLN
jgi:chorismate synthase